MPLVPAKCDNCGGVLQVDSSLKAANCPHCGSAYVVQDAINYYNSVTKVEHMHAEVVNVVDEKSSKAQLEAADTYLKLRKFDKAQAKYQEVIDLAPQEYRGWWGYIVAETRDFEHHIKSESALNKLQEYAGSVITLTSPEEHDELIQKWMEYYESETQKNKEEKESIIQQLEQLDADEKKHLQIKQEVERDGADIYKLLQSTGKRRSEPVTWVEIGGGAGSILFGMYALYCSTARVNWFLWMLFYISGAAVMIDGYVRYYKYDKQTKTIDMFQNNKRMYNQEVELLQKIATKKSELLLLKKEYE